MHYIGYSYLSYIQLIALMVCQHPVLTARKLVMHALNFDYTKI